MKRSLWNVLLLLILAVSCTRMDMSDGVKVVRPVIFDTTLKLPLSDDRAALRLDLSTDATAFDYSESPLSATIAAAFSNDITIRWFLNGELKADEHDTTINLGILPSGYYEIAAEIRHDSHTYGARLKFEIRK